MTPRKLKIFVSHPSHYLTDHAAHGDGLIAYSFLSRLAQRGHELHVATPLYDLKSALPKSIHLYPVKGRFAGSSGRQTIQHRLEYALSVRKLFDRLSRSVHFDLIHQLNPVVLGMSALLFGRGLPLIMGPYWPSWGHMNPSRRITHSGRAFQFLKGLSRRITFGRCDAILTPTSVSRAEVLMAGAKPESIFDMNIGIDPEAFAPAPQISPAEPTILFLANPMRRKGIFVLLDAFEIVSAKLPDCRLVIGGAGHELKTVRERVQGMKHGHRVTILGNVQRERIAETMQNCSVYCLPSFGEPFGMSALEAMSCGKALVVTNTGGLNDLVRERGGAKVTPGDSGALAEALERLLSDPQRQREMGSFNRQLVVREYAWDRVLDRLESIYLTLIERGVGKHAISNIQEVA